MLTARTHRSARPPLIQVFAEDHLLPSLATTMWWWGATRRRLLTKLAHTMARKLCLQPLRSALLSRLFCASLQASTHSWIHVMNLRSKFPSSHFVCVEGE